MTPDRAILMAALCLELAEVADTESIGAMWKRQAVYWFNRAREI
jgi:hypothetical protein